MAIGKQLRFEILKRDNFRCTYCGATAQASELRVDHVVPRASGGSDDPANLTTSCFDCNAGKTDRELHETRADVALPVAAAVERAKQARELLTSQAAAAEARDELAARFIDAWERAIGRVPRTVQGAAARLVSEWEMLDLDAAIEAVDRKMDRDGLSVESQARYFFGVLRNLRATRETEAMSPEDAEAKRVELAEEGRALLDDQQPQAALTALRASLRIGPSDRVSWDLAIALYRVDKYSDAALAFKALYDRGYTRWGSAYNIGCAFNAMGNIAAALPWLDAAASQNEDQPRKTLATNLAAELREWQAAKSASDEARARAAAAAAEVARAAQAERAAARAAAREALSVTPSCKITPTLARELWAALGTTDRVRFADVVASEPVELARVAFGCEHSGVGSVVSSALRMVGFRKEPGSNPVFYVRSLEASA
jgi:tetratricopeptide (TPR) repeat protein